MSKGPHQVAAMDIRNVDSVSQLLQVRQEAAKQGKDLVYLGDRQVRIVERGQISQVLSQLSGQARREARSLNEFAASLSRTEAGVPPDTELSFAQRSTQLIGKSLRPEVAVNYLGMATRDHGRTVSFNQRIGLDHLGTITSLPDDLSELELLELERGLTTALNRTNAAGERTAARTEGECVLEMLGALRQAGAQASQDASTALSSAERSLGDLWLSGQMNQARAQAALAQVATELAAAAPALADQAQALAREVGKDKQLTQRHDNTFGRMFESSLAKGLVDHPSPPMLAAADAVNRFLLQHMNTDQKHYTSAQNIDILAKALAKDPRPWHAEVPRLHDFLAQPNAQTLAGLMAPPVQDGYHMLLTYWMAAKVSSDVTGPWMEAANDNYNRTVKPSRSSQETVTSAKGATHAAQASLDATRMLDRVDGDLLKAIGATNDGDIKAELRTLRNDLPRLSNAISRAGGVLPQDDGAKRTERTALAQAIGEAADWLHAKLPETAQALRDLLPPLTTAPEGLSEDDIVLEVGTLGGVGSVAGWQAEDVKSAHYGTGLLHQPRPDVPDNWKAEVNVPSRTGVNIAAPKAFERNALESNQNTVNGVSGTTNMLTFLLNHMERAGALSTPDGQNLNKGDALAGNLAFLVIDGGHSIPEAMATAASIAADPREAPVADFMHLPTDQIKAARGALKDEIQANRQAALDSHVTSYAQLGKDLGGGDTGARLAQAVQAAFEATRNRFDALHAER
jgi:hypothetical protein